MQVTAVTFHCEECGEKRFTIGVEEPDDEHDRGAFFFTCDNCGDIYDLFDVSAYDEAKRKAAK